MSHPWSLGRLVSQGWTVMGLTELGRMCQPMNPAPWTWRACSPLHQPTTFRSGQILLQWNCAYCTQKMCSLWAGRALKTPWAPCLLVVGFPPPASFLRVAPPMDESTLPRVVLQELGFVQGTGVRKEEGMGQKPGVFPLAHSTLTI